MKIIINEDKSVNPRSLTLGNAGENVVSILEFEYPEKIEAMLKDEIVNIKTDTMYSCICFNTGVDKFTLPLVNKKVPIPFNLSKYNFTRAYLKFSKIENEEMPIWKSNVFEIYFKNSFETDRNGDGTFIPTDIERVNSALKDLDNKIDAIEFKKGEKGDKGDNGQDGKDGKDGQNGHTPVKGEDYFTTSDIENFISEVLNRIPVDTSLANRLNGVIV